MTSEVSVKALVTEKNLVKEAEKRLMQENQSLLDQQRSQNVLLTNLQSIQVRSFLKIEILMKHSGFEG